MNIYSGENRYFNSKFETVFKNSYEMIPKMLIYMYNDMLPDGTYYIVDNVFIIIVTMPYDNETCYYNGLNRLFKIYDNIVTSEFYKTDMSSFYTFYLILSCGKTDEHNKYYIYNDKKEHLPITLTDLYIEIMPPNDEDE